MKCAIFISALMLIYSSSIFGQKPCADYACVVAKVKKAITDKNYRFAFEQLESADWYPAKNAIEISNLRKQLFNAVEDEKKKADAATKRAENEAEKARLERDRAEEAKKTAEEKTELANRKSNEADLALKETILANDLAKRQKDSVEMKKEMIFSSTKLFFGFISAFDLNVELLIGLQIIQL